MKRELHDEAVERELGRRARGEWQPERVLAGVRRGMELRPERVSAAPRWAALAGLVGLLGVLAVLAVALPRLPAGPSAVSPTPEGQLVVLPTEDFAARLESGEMNGLTVLVQGAVEPIVHDPDVQKGHPGCGPSEEDECLDALGTLVGAEQVLVFKRWLAVPEPEASLHGGPRDGWQWWDSPEAPVEGRLVLSVDDSGRVIYEGRAPEPPPDSPATLAEIPGFDPAELELDEIVLVDGWLHARGRRVVPDCDPPGPGGRRCAEDESWLAPPGDFDESSALQVQPHAYADFSRARDDGDEDLGPRRGLYALAKRLALASCAEGQPPCWHWEVVARVHQSPSAQAPAESPTRTPESQLVVLTAQDFAAELRAGQMNGTTVLVEGRIEPHDKPAADCSRPSELCPVGVLAGATEQVQIYARGTATDESGDASGSPYPQEAWPRWRLPEPRVEGTFILTVDRLGSVEFVGTVGDGDRDTLTPEALSHLAVESADLDQVLIVDGWLVRAPVDEQCNSDGATAVPGLPGRACATGVWLGPANPGQERGIRVQDDALFLVRGDMPVSEPVGGRYVVARRLYGSGCVDVAPCWGWNVVAVLSSEPPSVVPPDIATPGTPAPRIEPSPMASADVIECRDIVRGRAGLAPTTPSGMFVTDHAGIVTGCISLGAGGDPPYQTGVEVTSTNPTSTNLEVVWPVPELCDYDPTSLSLWSTREGYLLQVDRLAPGDEPQACLAAFGQRKVQLALAAPIDVSTIDAALLEDGVGVDSVDEGGGIGFSLTLASDRTDYSSGDVIEVRASLGYEGRPGETLTLVGSGSGLVTFSVQQLDGDLSMGSPRTDDCSSYQMTAGEPQVYPYRKGAGWSADDPNAQFYRSWVEEPDFTLPSGTWRIEAYTEFYVGDCGGPLHEMEASIVITVR